MSLEAAQLGHIIRNHGPEIEHRWLERVLADIAEGAADVEPTHLKDGLPRYLKALADLFSEPSSEQSLSRTGEPVWALIAREHGVTRVRIGFNISQLVHEFIILHQVIREVAGEQGVEVGGPEAMLADALYAAVAASVGAYVEARDYEARQQQAENIGFLTHELRSPLMSAMLHASKIRRHVQPPQMPALEALDRCHRRLNALVDSVLLVERLEAGQTETQAMTMTLGDLIAPAIEDARTLALKKGIRFDVRIDEGQRVRCDPNLTRSALQNLAENAVKFTDSGHVEIWTETAENSFSCHVRDTCGGISPAELKVIFEPFKRGNTRKPGTGLGLAISRRAIEAQRGSIHAESQGDACGCHFWFVLPRVPAPASEASNRDTDDSERDSAPVDRDPRTV